MGTPDPTNVDGAAPLPAIGQVLGTYRVVEKIGEGRSGVVFRVKHVSLRTPHVLKVLRRRDSEVEARLRVEVEVQQRLRHPNAVPLTGVVEADGCFGLVIDAVDGPRLRHLLAEGSRMPVEDALPLMAEMLAGVNAAHRVGVLHLGLTPDVVRLVTLPERVCPRICDFGLAGALQTVPAPDSGGARYIAPELFDNPAGGSTASDVFSLGVLFYEMLAGVPPFWGRARAARGMPADVKPIEKLVPDCPTGVSEALRRALQWRPDDRFADCDSFARALFGEEFVLFDEDDVTDAALFDPKPEPTRPREGEAGGADPDSQPLLTDLLSGKVAAPSGRVRPLAESRDAGPPIIVGRTVQAERRAGKPAATAGGATVGGAPVGGATVGVAPVGAAPDRGASAGEKPAGAATVGASGDRVGGGSPVAPPDAGAAAIALLQGAVNVDAERAAAERAAALAEMHAPPLRPVRLAHLAFQFVVAPTVLLLGLAATQAGWAGYRLGQARAQAALASAVVDARLTEAFDDAERLIAQGAPAEPLQAAVDEGRAAKDLGERAAALSTLAEGMARAVQVLPPTTSPDALLERRLVSKSVDSLTDDLDAHLAAADELAEAQGAVLVGVGEALGFADGRPFGQEIPALRPQARLVAAVAEE